jgi:hypothetical protein
MEKNVKTEEQGVRATPLESKKLRFRLRYNMRLRWSLGSGITALVITYYNPKESRKMRFSLR